MVVKFADDRGPMVFATRFCSLPRDSAGYYKNFFVAAQAPADVAERERELARAVFASYQVPPALRQRILGPYTPPARAANMPARPGGEITSAPFNDKAALKFDCEILPEGTYLPSGDCVTFK
jgi:hypothetical protein